MDQVSNFTLCDISKVSDSYVRSYVSTLSPKSNFCPKTHKNKIIITLASLGVIMILFGPVFDQAGNNFFIMEKYIVLE